MHSYTKYIQKLKSKLKSRERMQFLLKLASDSVEFVCGVGSKGNKGSVVKYHSPIIQHKH